MNNGMMKRGLQMLAVLAALALPATVSADIFDLSWNTIDGGGATFSSGGAFSLGGTIGQPDAGVMSGGVYELQGGFWAQSPESPCGGTVRGDSDCSKAVDFNDIDCFVAALISEDAWNSCGNAGGCSYVCANDIDLNGHVDFNDIDGFVTCLVNNGCP